LTEPVVIAGLNVAGLQDLMAMKLKVMAERGEMRDYFDVKAIDEQGAISVEEGMMRPHMCVRIISSIILT
jgi:hypothetical protein